jgi:hypothetical protein
MISHSTAFAIDPGRSPDTFRQLHAWPKADQPCRPARSIRSGAELSR